MVGTAFSPSSQPNFARAALGGDWNAYLQARPDVRSEFQQESSRDEKSRSHLSAIGGDSEQGFARWHWNTYGRKEASPSDMGTTTAPYSDSPQSTDFSNIFGTSTPYGQQPAQTFGASADRPSTFTPQQSAFPSFSLNNPQQQPATFNNDARRAAEQSRISGITPSFMGLTREAQNAVRTASPYDGNYLDAVGSDLDFILAEIERNRSQDFGDLNTDLDSYISTINNTRGLLDQRRASRSTSLQRERDDLDYLMGLINSTPDSNTEMLNHLSSMLSSEYGDISRFSGSDLDDVMGLYSDARRGIQGRLMSAANTRSSIESELRRLLEEAEDGYFGSLDDVDNWERSRLRPARSRVQEYGATGAQDELQALMQFLSGHRSRLRQDMENVRLRESTEAGRVRRDRNGNAIYGGVAREPIMSEAELSALLTESELAALMAGEDDPMQPSGYVSSFATNLGL